ncbi:MAG: biopolymer transport protein ExbD [Rickettsiales bacterium]|jgi:biopolymer transport protein ExbD
MINLKHAHSHHELFEDLAPDLTPMLDIIFILLVFFMLTYGAVFKSLDLNLPASVAENQMFLNEESNITLEIYKDYFAINKQKIADFDALKIAINAAAKNDNKASFVIASDKEVAIEKLLKILTYLQSQGITNANILMKNE